MTEDNGCKVCGKHFEDPEDLKNHGKDDHPEVQEAYPEVFRQVGEVVCDECGEDVTNLEKHMEKHSPYDEDMEGAEADDEHPRINISRYKGDGEWEKVDKLDDAEEIDQQEDKPTQSHDDWLEDLKGMKDEFSTEELTKTVIDPEEPKEAEEEGGADDPLKKVDSLSESYRYLSKDRRAQIFESLGFTQGDSAILSGLEWNELTRPVKVEASEAYVKEFQEPEPQEEESEDGDEDEAYEALYNLERNHASPDYKKKAIECSRCNERFYNGRDKDIHFNEVHATEQEYELPEQCPFCKELIQEPDTLDWHMQEQHGAHVPSQFTQTGIDAGMADTNLDSLEAYKKATEGQGGTYGRGNFMLNPQHEDITTCVICGRDIDSHSNPNTDYRGMRGDAPPTDHYFLGGDQGGSDDKYDFESRKAGEGDDDYIDINEPFGSTRPIKKQEQDPEGYKKEWADVQEGGPGSGRKPEGGSNLSNSHKSALDKYVKQYGKDDQGSIHSIAGWGRDTHLPANILKQVKDASDDDILDYVRSKASEIELPDELRDPWGYDFDGYDKDGFSSGYPNADPLLRIMHKTGTPWDEDAMNSMDRFIQNAEDEVYDYVKSNPNSSEWDILNGLGWQNGTSGPSHIADAERKGHIKNTGGGYVAESRAKETLSMQQRSKLYLWTKQNEDKIGYGFDAQDIPYDLYVEIDNMQPSETFHQDATNFVIDTATEAYAEEEMPEWFKDPEQREEAEKANAERVKQMQASEEEEEGWGDNWGSPEETAKDLYDLTHPEGDKEEAEEEDVLVDDSGEELDWFKSFGDSYTDGNQTLVDTDTPEMFGHALKKEGMKYDEDKGEYGWESRASDLKAQIKKKREFINMASFENPLNMGDDQRQLDEMEAELASLGEGYIDDSDNAEEKYVCDDCDKEFNSDTALQEHQYSYYHGDYKDDSDGETSPRNVMGGQ